MDEKTEPPLYREDDEERGHIPVTTSRMLALRAAQLVLAVAYAVLDAFAAVRLQFGSVRRHASTMPQPPKFLHTNVALYEADARFPYVSTARTYLEPRPRLMVRSSVACGIFVPDSLPCLAWIQHRAASQAVPLGGPLVSRAARTRWGRQVLIRNRPARMLEILTNLAWLASWAMLAVLATGLNQMQKGTPAAREAQTTEASTQAQQVSDEAMAAARIIVAAASGVGMLAWGLLGASLVSTSERAPLDPREKGG